MLRAAGAEHVFQTASHKPPQPKSGGVNEQITAAVIGYGGDVFMRFIPYDRASAVAYAERWALSRNPAYYDFSELGGDCTNFISQCVYAGCGVMNYTPQFGWYYINLNDRAPAWTGVNPFYRFMTENQGRGPFARSVTRVELLPGDVVQLGSSEGVFYHSLLVLGVSGGEVYVATHSYDSLWRELSSYSFARARYLHFLGARK